jgi:hypothetical protein
LHAPSEWPQVVYEWNKKVNSRSQKSIKPTQSLHDCNSASLHYNHHSKQTKEEMSQRNNRDNTQTHTDNDGEDLGLTH